jgi:hypothetical protein
VRRIVLVVTGILWLGCAGVGLGWLFRYSATAGAPARAPSEWPAETRITRSPDTWTVLLFAHPHCPCTRASLGELAVLLAQARGVPVRATVVLAAVRGMQASWGDADLRKAAVGIPEVGLFEDEGGAEARRFGAYTSGQTLLYEPSGRLVFDGGITGARGHAGDNAGRETVRQLLRGREPAGGASAPVFGCSISGSHEAVR